MCTPLAGLFLVLAATPPSAALSPLEVETFFLLGDRDVIIVASGFPSQDFIPFQCALRDTSGALIGISDNLGGAPVADVLVSIEPGRADEIAKAECWLTGQ